MPKAPSSARLSYQDLTKFAKNSTQDLENLEGTFDEQVESLAKNSLSPIALNQSQVSVDVNLSGLPPPQQSPRRARTSDGSGSPDERGSQFE